MLVMERCIWKPLKYQDERGEVISEKKLHSESLIETNALIEGRTKTVLLLMSTSSMKTTGVVCSATRPSLLEFIFNLKNENYKDSQ